MFTKEVAEGNPPSFIRAEAREQKTRYRAMTTFQQEEKAEKKLETLRRKEEEESTKILSQKYKIPYANLSMLPVEIDAIKIIPEDRARSADLVAFQMTGKHLKIGLRNPEREEARILLKRLEEDRHNYELFLVSKHSLEYAWDFYKRVPATPATEAGIIEVPKEKLDSMKKEVSGLGELKKLIESAFFAKTTEVMELILAGALAQDASDIHMEPQEEGARLRFRLDGVLHDISILPSKLFHFILGRIKLVSELKLNVKDKAQDGRFTIRIQDLDVEVRTSTLPGPYGENIVLRLLNPKGIQVKFNELGMQPWMADTMRKELERPNGMILTTGPTGSGKTTTLYTFLKELHSPEVKIITIEDPIEYHLRGIEQSQVEPDKGYTFANGLRAIVRQDPDIILVGEIRDLETAEIAMQASLTGHLVLSTLHTNSAAGTVPRLMDLGVKPASIAPAIKVAMAQRLVRRLCKSCRIPITPDENLKRQITEELAKFPPGVPVPQPQEWTLFKAKEEGPCPTCSGIGYKGRISVYEIILINDEISLLILKSPSEYEIKKAAKNQGQISMRQDGLLKSLAGITDLEEVERMVGME